jgi:hypothetical protein
MTRKIKDKKHKTYQSFDFIEKVTWLKAVISLLVLPEDVSCLEKPTTDAAGNPRVFQVFRF